MSYVSSEVIHIKLTKNIVKELNLQKSDCLLYYGITDNRLIRKCKAKVKDIDIQDLKSSMYDKVFLNQPFAVINAQDRLSELSKILAKLNQNGILIIYELHDFMFELINILEVNRIKYQYHKNNGENLIIIIKKEDKKWKKCVVY